MGMRPQLAASFPSISMLNLCMKLTVCTKMAAMKTSLEDFIKIGGPQQCLLKMTGQNCC